jgi:hypothetical protein
VRVPEQRGTCQWVEQCEAVNALPHPHPMLYLQYTHWQSGAANRVGNR